MSLCFAAKDSVAKEGALQTELHDLCAGYKTEVLDDFFIGTRHGRLIQV